MVKVAVNYYLPFYLLAQLRPSNSLLLWCCVLGTKGMTSIWVIFDAREGLGIFLSSFVGVLGV